MSCPRGGVAPVPPQIKLTAAEGLASAHDAEPVEIEGTILYRSRTLTQHALVLREDGTEFTAVLPAHAAEGTPEKQAAGSRGGGKGICHILGTPGKTHAAVGALPEAAGPAVPPGGGNGRPRSR